MQSGSFVLQWDITTSGDIISDAISFICPVMSPLTQLWNHAQYTYNPTLKYELDKIILQFHSRKRQQIAWSGSKGNLTRNGSMYMDDKLHADTDDHKCNFVFHGSDNPLKTLWQTEYAKVFEWTMKFIARQKLCQKQCFTGQLAKRNVVLSQKDLLQWREVFTSDDRSISNQWNSTRYHKHARAH